MVRPSGIWKYFEYVDDRVATCKTCKGSFSHSSSSTNLRKHLASKHPEIDLYQTRKYTKPIKYEIGIHRPGSSKINMTKRKSFIWRHYKVLNHSIAVCRVCQKRISYKTSISNLKKHIIKRHPLVDLSEAAQFDADTTANSPDMDMDVIYDEEDNSFPDDLEDVKALLGLTGAQVEKTIEIIEELDNGNHHILYHQDKNGDTNHYDDEDLEDDEGHYSDQDHADDFQEESFQNNGQYANSASSYHGDEDYSDNDCRDTTNNHSFNTYKDFCADLENNVKLEIKTPAKPVLKKCLESVLKQTKAEPPPVIEPPKDPIDVLVENIAIKLRQMPYKQLLIAEIKIQEVLSLGENEQLRHPREIAINS